MNKATACQDFSKSITLCCIDHGRRFCCSLVGVAAFRKVEKRTSFTIFFLFFFFVHPKLLTVSFFSLLLLLFLHIQLTLGYLHRNTRWIYSCSISLQQIKTITLERTINIYLQEIEIFTKSGFLSESLKRLKRFQITIVSWKFEFTAHYIKQLIQIFSSR